jgi:tRNA A64-2'-O-ribosylphosphate transferase
VPIWAAVLNRAVLRLRQGAAAAAAAEAWDQGVHLPAWISANEQNQIRQRIPAMVDELVEVGADLSELAAALAKPLRCVWASQEGPAWWEEGGAFDPGTLPFTPVVLVSASLPNARARRRLRLDDVAPGVDVMFDYVPGAGDDEETWARGLTPAVLWAHTAALLRAGPGGVAAAVRLLAKQPQPQPAQRCDGAEDGSALRWVGDTRLALGASAACVAPAVWDAVDAVMHVGSAAEQAASLAEEPRCGVCQAPGGSSVQLDGALTRYLHLPIASHKDDKHALLRRLPAAVQFASAHLAAGRRVLVAGGGGDGAAAAVCALLACLLACFSLEGLEGPPQLRWRREARPHAGTRALQPVAPEFGRLTVRQHLAALAAQVPQAAVPCKGMLKQVYNCFLADSMTIPPG